MNFSILFFSQKKSIKMTLSSLEVTNSIFVFMSSNFQKKNFLIFFLFLDEHAMVLRYLSIVPYWLGSLEQLATNLVILSKLLITYFFIHYSYRSPRCLMLVYSLLVDDNIS